ncbi:hypothetical protein D9M71_572840 [compost metagenome]
MAELRDAAGDAAGRVHHQDDGVGLRVVDGGSELLGQHVQRRRTRQRRKEVGVAEHRAGDRQQRHVAALCHRSSVLQGLALPSLQGFWPFILTAGDGGDGLQHVRGDGPGLA